MHEALSDIVRVSCWSGLLWSTEYVRKVLCTACRCVAGQRRSSRGLMLGLLELSSQDRTCGGRRSLLLRSDLSSALDVMQRHIRTPVLIERIPTNEIWRSAYGVIVL